MAKQVLTNAAIFFGGYNLRTHANSVAVNISADEVETTSFADDTHTFIGGLKGIGVGISGFWEAPTPDSPLFAALAQAGSVVSVAAGPTAGDVAYFMRALLSRYAPGAQIGDVMRFDLSCATNDRLIRGLLFHNGTTTASGNTSGIQLGSVSSTQRIYSALHVTAVSGTTPTLTVNVQSDDNSGFSSPTTRVSHTAQTAIGSSFVSQAGPITDTWWRLNYSISGTAPSFTWAGLIGIY